MDRSKYGLCLLGVAAACVGGCIETAPVEAVETGILPSRSRPLVSPLDVARVPAPLPAGHCDVNVEGTGVVDFEAEYLPNVVRCENGGANLEALKAQAIAARSVAYYAVETDGQICDSQGCQVFSCGGSAEAIHHQAVQETSGIYLMNNATLTYGFYVAGDNDTAPPACVGVSGSTEQWVTYNEGQSGTDVEQTELGFVFAPTDNGYGQNRGCMSQWGARCLENNNDYDYVDILRFYYGEDIQLVQAKAECITPIDPPGGTEGSSSGEGSEATGTRPGTTSGPDPSAGAEAGPTSVTDSAPEEGGDEGIGTSDSDSAVGDDGPDAGSGTGIGSASDPGSLPDNYGGGAAEGCGCQAPAPRPGLGWLVLGLLACGRRRRR